MSADQQKKRQFVAVEMKPDIRGIVEKALAADPENDASKLFRRALRHWVDEAPQAMDEYELYSLKALRSLKKKSPALWASILRTLHSAAKSTGAGMSEQMYEELGDLTETHQPAPTKRRKSG